MDSQKIKIPMPLKGVNRALGRESQPEGTCYDALNILPFDLQGRIRLSSRGGLGFLNDLGTAAPVRLLHVAFLGGGVSSGSTPIWTENFVYANGNLTGHGGWTTDPVGSDVSWVVSGDKVITTALAVNSNLNSTGLAAFNPALGYTITAVFNVANDGGTGTDLEFDWSDSAADTQISAGFLFDTSSSSGPSFNSNMTFQVEKWNGVGNSLSVEYDTSTFTFGVDHTLVISQTGTTVTCTLDGTVIGTVTAANAYGTSPFFRLYSSDDQNVITVKSIVVAAGGTGQSIARSQSKLITCSGTQTFWGSQPSNVVAATNTGTYPIDSTSLFVSAATLFGKTYIVDGTSIRKLDTATGVMAAYAASAGTAPTGCTIAVNWRGRLVLSGADSDPQNIYASRAGTQPTPTVGATDWDYSQPDPLAAWAMNLAPSGRVGPPVVALMPLSDDTMLVGGEQSIWKISGDPADGGAIHPVSDTAGVSGPNAWCRGPDGTVYWVGPTGLFKMSPWASTMVSTAPFEEISKGMYPQFSLAAAAWKNWEYTP